MDTSLMRRTFYLKVLAQLSCNQATKLGHLPCFVAFAVFDIYQIPSMINWYKMFALFYPLKKYSYV